jgi:DNA-binding NarL/FixJ family response regulator
MSEIRVMIVDDHPCVIQGVKACLETAEQIQIVGHAADGLVAVREAKRLNPDVILMDLSLPRVSGIEAMKAIHGDLPRVGLIAFTMHESGEKVREAATAGARGYVLKSSPFAEVVKAIKAVNAGGRYFDSALHGSKIDESSTGGFSDDPPFENRDAGKCGTVREAMKYIERHRLRSLTVKEVALEVGIHPSDLDRFFSRVHGLTVKQYVDRLRKGEVEDRLRRGCHKGSQIAMELGFRDDQSFYRWIHRVFGISFSELRKSALTSSPGVGR